MKIAKIKIEENIAEYILYMYQIEDTIRAFNFNIDQIMMHVVQPQLDNQNDLNSYKSWYLELIKKMKIQGIEKQGHLGELSDIIVELSYLHNTLLTIANDKKYQNIAENTTPFVEEFKNKSNLKEKNTIEILLHAMYMKLLLKLSKKPISDESEEAFDSMRIQLAYLVAAYHKMKKGNLDFLKN
tara:strand:- start:139 stop:690 length:552 start_codon:yes stop_codon:yes gene_type:complete